MHNGFDLDLSYISPRIIAMGLPAQGTEGLYRNPMRETLRFLQTYHHGHCKVYNLCTERSYPAESLGAAPEQLVHLPFEDQQTPPLSVVRRFCHDAKQWLSKDPSNVVVVHCKAGKGRTGLMICCLLLHLHMTDPALANLPALVAAAGSGDGSRGDGGGAGRVRRAAAAFAAIATASAHSLSQLKLDLSELGPDPVAKVLQMYAARRTHDGRGITIPSQRRYVRYYWHILRMGGMLPPTRPVRLHRLEACGLPPGLAATCYLVVTCRRHGAPAAAAPETYVFRSARAGASAAAAAHAHAHGGCTAGCLAVPAVGAGLAANLGKDGNAWALDAAVAVPSECGCSIEVVLADAALAGLDAEQGEELQHLQRALQLHQLREDSADSSGWHDAARPSTAPVAVAAALAARDGCGAAAANALEGDRAEAAAAPCGACVEQRDLVVDGDVRVQLVSGGVVLCYCWVNTSFLPSDGALRLGASELDKISKQLLPKEQRASGGGALTAASKLELVMEYGEAGGGAPAAAAESGRGRAAAALSRRNSFTAAEAAGCLTAAVEAAAAPPAAGSGGGAAGGDCEEAPAKTAEQAVSGNLGRRVAALASVFDSAAAANSQPVAAGPAAKHTGEAPLADGGDAARTSIANGGGTAARHLPPLPGAGDAGRPFGITISDQGVVRVAAVRAQPAASPAVPQAVGRGSITKHPSAPALAGADRGKPLLAKSPQSLAAGGATARGLAKGKPGAGAAARPGGAGPGADIELPVLHVHSCCGVCDSEVNGAAADRGCSSPDRLSCSSGGGSGGVGAGSEGGVQLLDALDDLWATQLWLGTGQQTPQQQQAPPLRQQQQQQAQAAHSVQSPPATGSKPPSPRTAANGSPALRTAGHAASASAPSSPPEPSASGAATWHLLRPHLSWLGSWGGGSTSGHCAERGADTPSGGGGASLLLLPALSAEVPASLAPLGGGRGQRVRSASARGSLMLPDVESSDSCSFSSTTGLLAAWDAGAAPAVPPDAAQQRQSHFQDGVRAGGVAAGVAPCQTAAAPHAAAVAGAATSVKPQPPAPERRVRWPPQPLPPPPLLQQPWPRSPPAPLARVDDYDDLDAVWERSWCVGARA